MDLFYVFIQREPIESVSKWEKNLEGDWTKLLSLTFKANKSDKSSNPVEIKLKYLFFFKF